MARGRARSSLLVCLILTDNIQCINGTSIKGYNFGDNMMNVRNGPDNGYLRADMPGPVPHRLSFCARIYPQNIRHGDKADSYPQKDIIRGLQFVLVWTLSMTL